jgi:hypothetical protein
MPGSAISEDVARTERDTGRQLRTQVAVAARTADELAHDQQCPALTEHVEPIGDRTLLVVVPPPSHAILYHLDGFQNQMIDLFVY